MEYQTRKYPLFAACGLNCGLCPRYYTAGPSRCPGCAGEGFSAVHPSCGVLSCCRCKGLEYCFDCPEFPCGKYESADSADSFITHKNQFTDLDKAKRIGIKAYEAELNEKVFILEELLKNYNDGRRKGFYCLAVNLLDLKDVKSVMERLTGTIRTETPIKEKAVTAVRFFNEIAGQRGVTLKLRK